MSLHLVHVELLYATSEIAQQYYSILDQIEARERIKIRRNKTLWQFMLEVLVTNIIRVSSGNYNEFTPSAYRTANRNASDNVSLFNSIL
jgi:hypothetical protein